MQWRQVRLLIGIRSDWLKYLLLVLLALAVVTGIQAAGVILTSALLVTPAATASLLTDRFPRSMLIAAVISVASSVIGLYTSFYLQASSGAAIVLTCTVIFVLVWLARSAKQRFSPPAEDHEHSGKPLPSVSASRHGAGAGSSSG